MPTRINITPSTKILHATARTGYDWTEAIFELADNGFDAIRRKMANSKKKKGYSIMIHPVAVDKTNKTGSLRISDNGIGIEKDFLMSGGIFSMGESKTRTASPDSTGTFGMGMKAAAQTLGTRLKILTTTTDITNLVGASIDFQHVVNIGKWEAEFLDAGDITEQDRNQFRKMVGRKSGTLIIIDGILDGVPTTPSIRQTLRRKMAHYYRHILNSDSKLGYSLPCSVYLGSTKDRPIQSDWDPLCVAHERTDVFIGDKSGNFDEHEYKGYKFKILLAHTKLTKGERASTTEGLHALGAYHSGVVRQGAYFIRNGREITNLPLWKHSSTAGNLYAEVAFIDSGRDTLDGKPPIRTDYGKKGVVIDDNFKSYVLRVIIDPYLKRLGKEAREAAANITKGSRDAIKKVIEQTPLPDTFGRARKSGDKKNLEKINKIFQKSDKKVKRTNSKYRGTTVETGNNDIEIRFEEQKWFGSEFPYNVEFTAGDPYVKIILNVEDPWIMKGIYENTNATEVALRLQQVAASCCALMHEDDEIKNRIIASQGILLNLFDEDFGRRVEAEVENVELEPVFLTETHDEPEEAIYN